MTDRVRVRWKNGYQSTLRKVIAERLRDKGQLEILPAEEPKPEEAEAPKKRSRGSGKKKEQDDPEDVEKE